MLYTRWENTLHRNNENDLHIKPDSIQERDIKWTLRLNITSPYLFDVLVGSIIIYEADRSMELKGIQRNGEYIGKVY